MVCLDSLVGMNVCSTTESNILHHGQSVQGEKVETFRKLFVLRFTRGWALWNRITGDCSSIAALPGLNKIHANLLQSNSRVIDSRFHTDINSLLTQQIACCVYIQVLKEI
mmetsp:Transcript_65289/g.189236  ORF Transcript_65289/g.189236 Transcript_65289/m.189236 type:complete len:110 (-) Transcript_65289:82-411(-)